MGIYYLLSWTVLLSDPWMWYLMWPQVYKVTPYVECPAKHDVSFRLGENTCPSDIAACGVTLGCVGCIWAKLSCISLVDTDRHYPYKNVCWWSVQRNAQCPELTWVLELKLLGLAIDCQPILPCQYWPYESYDWCEDFGDVFEGFLGRIRYLVQRLVEFLCKSLIQFYPS